MKRLIEKNYNLENMITATDSAIIDLNGADKYSVQCNYDDITPAADTFISADDTIIDIEADTVKITAHPFVTGLKGRLTTTGTLPAGVTTGTDYFIIVIDEDTIQFASSLADALAGTAIDLTDLGATGTNTFTPTAIAGATVVLNKSNDGINFINTASPTSITADGKSMFEVANVSYRYVKISYAITAGMLSADNFVLVIGDSI